MLWSWGVGPSPVCYGGLDGCYFTLLYNEKAQTQAVLGQGLLFHAQLDVLMAHHAEFMFYSKNGLQKKSTTMEISRTENMAPFVFSSFSSCLLPVFSPHFSLHISIFFVSKEY